jgi:hypothetical protein
LQKAARIERAKAVRKLLRKLIRTTTPAWDA